jgi:hypothetical protein
MDFQNEVVRALWWKQPYAAAMLVDKIETRTWHTNVRGKVLLCASAKPYHHRQILEISSEKQFQRIYDVVGSQKWEYGKAIAIGELVDCRPMVKQDEALTYVQFREGLYCHIYENVRAIEPFEIKGAQGWRILNYEQKALIKLL